MIISSTKDYATRGKKILVYGQAGIGKTCLCATLPNPIILSAEAGLLSLKRLDIPVIEIKTMRDLQEAYEWLTTSEDAKQFESICLDSISEIAEVVLAHEKENERDPRKAYVTMNDTMESLIRAFRDIPDKNIYIVAKQKRINDDGKLLYEPDLPGQNLPKDIPYFFDGVYSYQIFVDSEKNPHRVLLTQPDGKYQAKDRSGDLDMYEEPDLGAIIRKIKGETDG